MKIRHYKAIPQKVLYYNRAFYFRYIENSYFRKNCHPIYINNDLAQKGVIWDM